MTTMIDDVDSTVAYLNQDMYETSPPQVAQFLEENQISFNSNGDTIIISFLGVQLWNSDDDPREYLDENLGLYKVSLQQFIRGKIIEIINLISQIKLE
jgi:hypothetical protein